MNFGLSTYFLVKMRFRDALKHIISSGFNTIELSLEIPHVLEIDRDVINYLKYLRSDGIDFSMHAPFLEINLGSFFEDVRRYSKKRIIHAINTACAIGCNPVVIHPCYTFVKDKSKSIEAETRENFIQDLKEVLELAYENGIKIALENVHMPFFFFYNMDDFKALKEIIPGLGIALDLGHAFIAKRTEGIDNPEQSIIEDIEYIGMENIFHVHLHNNYGSKDEHLFLHGDMDIKQIISFLKTKDYSEKIIIESSDPELYGMDSVLKKIEELKDC
ncbi:MAG TPA: sugar phosphate isomerase/epimerase family protein [Syntrophorhabdaceae bacterium]|nr:sugar phosphate isomerase/epimerase family protein [Syntrophorhabdaceae bacterium]